MSTLVPLMNDTKWDELRLAMYGLGPLSPRWRAMDVERGHLSEWDGEWYYHFRNGGYRFIEWVELEARDPEQTDALFAALRTIHVPGERTATGFRVYGYSRDGMAVGYLC